MNSLRHCEPPVFFQRRGNLCLVSKLCSMGDCFEPTLLQ